MLPNDRLGSPGNQDVIMNKTLSNNVIWLLVAGYFLWVLADSFFRLASTGVSATVNVFFVIAIATLHGLRRYSVKQFLIFFLIAFTVSNFYENLSILTGFPFGHYHYTEALGPKLFLVPLLIAPAYFGCGYLAWSLAHVFVGVFGNKLRAEQIWRRRGRSRPCAMLGRRRHLSRGGVAAARLLRSTCRWSGALGHRAGVHPRQQTQIRAGDRIRRRWP